MAELDEYLPKSLIVLLTYKSLTKILKNKIYDLINVEMYNNIRDLSKILDIITIKYINNFYKTEMKRIFYTVNEVWKCFNEYSIDSGVPSVLLDLSFILLKISTYYEINKLKPISIYNNETANPKHRFFSPKIILYSTNLETFTKTIKSLYIFSNKLNTQLLFVIKLSKVDKIKIINNLTELIITKVIFNFMNTELEILLTNTENQLKTIDYINEILVNKFTEEINNLLIKINEIILDEIEFIYNNNKIIDLGDIEY